MKKTLKKTLLVTALTLCANGANAQFSDLLKNAASKVQSAASNTNSSTLSAISSIISSKLIPNSSQIVGTWAYKEPAVMFTSSNALKSAASSVVSKNIETKLQGYLSKVGISEGKMTITFADDKSFYVSRSGKKVATGTYSLTDSDVTLTFKGRRTPCKVTPQLNNGTLVIVMDVTKLKTFFEGIGSNVSQLATVTSLLKTMDGMKVGIRMTKK
ncbi:MAG: DUF4923 family protein [Prevotella sp.]|nr:DUF4923 family protein [Prevotella sp.]